MAAHPVYVGRVRVAFDSRPSADRHGGGEYARRLLQALRETAGELDEISEARRPRGADVFHAPWMEAAMLHSPCPMVVTLHDLTELKRPSERLRCGGMHLRLRHLALARATRVIVPSGPVAAEAAAELGIERERIVVIPHASATAPPNFAQATAPPICARPDRVQPSWSWQDVARETWAVYRLAFARPHRPYVVRRSEPAISRRPAARARPGLS
jgi:Glycosyltransferase Family 4